MCFASMFGGSRGAWMEWNTTKSARSHQLGFIFYIYYLILRSDTTSLVLWKKISMLVLKNGREKKGGQIELIWGVKRVSRFTSPLWNCYCYCYKLLHFTHLSLPLYFRKKFFSTSLSILKVNFLRNFLTYTVSLITGCSKEEIACRSFILFKCWDDGISRLPQIKKKTEFNSNSFILFHIFLAYFTQYGGVIPVLTDSSL